MSEQVDCVIVGAGVVGLAIGRELALRGREVLVLEAQSAIGTGISSRNSEVIHAGIYYPSGSLKAALCVEGRRALYEYCERHGVAHRRTGKIIVATSDRQLVQLRKYAAQGTANGVSELRQITAAEVARLEPAVRCVGGLESACTGIVDSHELMLAYRADLEGNDGTVVVNSAVRGGALLADGVELHVGDMALRARMAVNAGGLDAQRISRSLQGVAPESIPSLFLAKGHYFTLAGRSPFNRLVYPIADEAGLGIHVTLDLAGHARFGPDVQWVDGIDYGFDNSRRAAFCAAIKAYYPDLDEARLQPAYVGIRPKIANAGQVAADFCIRGPADHGGASYVALYGIESPGLTASLALGRYVAQLLLTPSVATDSTC